MSVGQHELEASQELGQQKETITGEEQQMNTGAQHDNVLPLNSENKEDGLPANSLNSTNDVRGSSKRGPTGQYIPQNDDEDADSVIKRKISAEKAADPKGRRWYSKRLQNIPKNLMLTYLYSYGKINY